MLYYANDYVKSLGIKDPDAESVILRHSAGNSKKPLTQSQMFLMDAASIVARSGCEITAKEAVRIAMYKVLLP